jgi:hypothetical protein
VAAQTNVTVTAVSSQDATKSGAATVAIVPPRITQVVPPVVTVDANTLSAGRIVVTLNATGVIASDTFKVTPALPILGSQFVNGNLVVTVGFDTPHQTDGEFSFQICAPDGTACSPPADLILAPNQNALTVAPSGSFVMLDLGTVSRFNPDGTAAGSFSIGSGAGGVSTIASDGSGNTVVEGTTYNASGTAIGLVTDDGNGGAMGTGASGTTGCITRQSANLLSCFTTAQLATPMRSTATTGAEPWLTELVNLPSGAATELDAVVFYRQSAELRRYSTATMAMQGTALPTLGVTPKSQFPVGVGMWRLVVFRSGPAQGAGALLSEADNLLIFFDISSMTELRRVTLPGAAAVNLAADQTHGAVIVPRVDKTFLRVDVATATPAALTAQSPFPAMGLAVSSEGTKLFVGRRGQLVVLANQ